MKQVQEYARHANFNLTADTYSHVLSGTKAAQLNAICSEIKLEENMYPDTTC
jgi:hypothetical protein